MTADDGTNTGDRTNTAAGEAVAGARAADGTAQAAGGGPAYALPDATRADAGLATFGTWHVGTPERQRAAVEAIAATWRRLPWPDPELLGYSVYSSTDGETLLHYAQWTSAAAYEEHVTAGRQAAHLAEVDAVVPGIERAGETPYLLYRSAFTPGARGPQAPVPGCVIAVSIEFEGPDEERLRRWVDGWFRGDESEVDDFDGLLAAHFHVSTDGTRVLNYAEWVSEQAHIDALATLHATHPPEPAAVPANASANAPGNAPTNASANDRPGNRKNDHHNEHDRAGDHGNGRDNDHANGREGDQWERQLAFPGLKSTGFKRYHLRWSGTGRPVDGAAGQD